MPDQQHGTGVLRPAALAGFSRVDITPPLESMEVFGLGYWFKRSVRFNSVRDPLYARALALGDDETCQIFISVDALNDSYRFIPAAQEAISARLGIAPGRVFITCTHTHSAPAVGINRTTAGSMYGPYVAERVVRAATEAFDDRAPASCGISQLRAPGIVRNRRPLLRNGKIAELHAPLAPEDVVDAGPVDDTLTVVNFRRESGELAGAICHFGIHGVCVQCSDRISSDCMGRAIQQLEAESQDAVVLHMNAPCADIDPVDMGSDAALDATASRLYAALSAAVCDERPVTLTPQESRSRCFRARRRQTRTAAWLDIEEQRLAAIPADAALSHHSGAGYERFLLEEERAVREFPEMFDVPYQIFRTGEVLCIGIGGEVFTRFGQHLKSVAAGLTILPIGIVGASAGYLPPSEAFGQGGYEVAVARWSYIAPGEPEKLFNEIEREMLNLVGAEAR